MGSADARAERAGSAPQGESEKGRKREMAERKQARANIPGWLGVLAVIAVASFTLLGWAVANRDAHAGAWVGLATATAAGEVTGSSAPVEPARSAAQPLSMLADGIARDAATAEWALGHDRATTAAVAMDAARRGADVGRGGAPAAARAAFDEVLRLVDEARHAHQNGNTGVARAMLARVGASIARVPAGTAPSPPTDPTAYHGVKLLDAEGMMIGVVETVRPAGATLVIGGRHQVLGFLDFGGTRIDVPLDRLVFGEPRTVGPTYVVLGTTGHTAEEIRRGSEQRRVVGRE